MRLRRLTAELRRLACTDALTGVANRRVFDERLGAEYKRSLRTGQPLGPVMVDIDHFKASNDHYGHPAGDQCLREVAAVLRDGVRRTTTCWRAGAARTSRCCCPVRTQKVAQSS